MRKGIVLLHSFFIICEASSWVVPDFSTFKVVHPSRSDSAGHVKPGDLIFKPSVEEPRPRPKRKTDLKNDPYIEDPEEKFYVVINNEKEEILLELTPNKKLHTSYTLIEWILEGGETIVRRFSRNCFYFGKDVKATGPSMVAVSNCDGLTGYIRTNNESYFIEPLTLDLKEKLLQNSDTGNTRRHSHPKDSVRANRLQNEIDKGPRPHVIYKVKTILNKLNLSIQKDQDYDHFDDLGRTFKKNRRDGISPEGADVTRWSSESESDFKGHYGKMRPRLLSDSVALKRFKRSHIRDFRHLKGGKRMAFLYKRDFDEVKEEKKKKRRKVERRKRDRCKKGRKYQYISESEEKRRICKSKREKRTKKRELKEKRAVERGLRKKLREQKRRRKERRRKQRERKQKGQRKEKITKDEKHSSVMDPLQEEDWHGYSPDLLWDTPTAAGRSGLSEVLLGAPINETDPQKWLELSVGIDHTVIDFHGEKDVEKYVFTLFNIVSAIYEDPSLEANLQIVLLRLIFYKDKKHSQVKTGLAKRSLEAVNRWAERLHKASPGHLKHDLAVWLTRHDLGGPSGYAPVSGICEPSRSCTLNRDEGLTSAFIIAHEMGHVLGMSHDGDAVAGNPCESEGLMGSVMAPLVAATFQRFHWSRCSKGEYHYLSKDWNCLRNEPQYENATLMSSSIKYQYTLDDQCRMEFGNGYALCETFAKSDPCTFLWCSNGTSPHLCKTKKGPPLEGTICGEDKWCRRGYCESIFDRLTDEESTNELTPSNAPVRHNPQHGGWSHWSDWGHCSRTCGTGVNFRTRACDSPEPRWGGRTCQGKREEWRVCSIDPCPVPIDLRSQQCERLQDLVKLGKRRSKLAWLPYEPRKRRKKCRMTCYSRATNEVYMGKEFLLDGTRCSYENQDDICVQGKCITLGCDKKIGSTKLTDRCGECGGGDKNCKLHTFVYKGVPQREYARVVTLPKDSWQISVKEGSSTANFFSMKNNDSKVVLNAQKVQGPALDLVVEGALFHYVQRGEHDYLFTSGPLLNDVTVLIHGGDVLEPVTVTTSYLMQENPEIYKWEIGPLSGCSATCGGGVRFETLICRNRRTKEEVSHIQCDHLPMPRVDAVPCNQFGCTFRWISDTWEHCTQTCGQDGIQSRVVSCVRVDVSNGEKDTSNAEIIDPLQCSDQTKPDSERPCNVVPCPAYWQSIGWTKCSVTCGVGEQQHIFYCEGDTFNEVTSECGVKPREMRACFKAECPKMLDYDCVKDKSPFCQSPFLHRYCKIPKYRQLCCHTCSNVIPLT